MRNYILPNNFFVDFHSFCDNCPDFIVCQKSRKLIGSNGSIINEHVISCGNYDRCKNMYENIKNR